MANRMMLRYLVFLTLTKTLSLDRSTATSPSTTDDDKTIRDSTLEIISFTTINKPT